MNLTPEEKEIGKQNFHEAVGTTRREFLRNSVLVGGTAFGASLGANYFNYGLVDDRLRVGIIGTGDEGGVLIGALNPDYIDVKAVADIRSYSTHRAFHGDWYSAGAHEVRPGLIEVYGWSGEDQAREKIKVFEGESGDYKSLIDSASDLDIEAVIIALPLHLHDAAAIYAMQNGLHVLTEKLMAHSVAQCKEMARVARDEDLILATGHQRHYSILYDNAVDQVRRGLIGDIHHIRAQWHRANMPGKDSWQPPLPDTTGNPIDELSKGYLAKYRVARKKGSSALQDLAAEYPLLAKLRSWQGALDRAKGKDIELWEKRVKQVRAQLTDQADAEGNGFQEKTLSNGYVRSPLEELLRWRLWDRTGGGLMAELGSHQLDAASIFISAQRDDGKKVLPLSVSGIGMRSLFPLDRDVNDHVHCIFDFPAPGHEDDPNKKIVVSYSSINGNGYGGWGEVVLGTKGTFILEREQEAMLFKGASTTTRIEVKEGNGGAAMDTYETGGGAAVAQAATPENVSRGYREEIEHWAWCVRNRDAENQPRCTPEVALADAVIALTSNKSIKESQRIEFNPAWFDIDSDETPEGTTPRKSSEIA